MKQIWFFVTLFLLVNAAAAQQPAPTVQYAAKFICGKSDGTVMAPGTYFTAINVHNPGNQPVSPKKSVAIALPGENPGPVRQFPEPFQSLGHDQAYEIDCPEIVRLAPIGGFIKGFVLIETEAELDVVAVYSAAGATGQVETMEIERVPPRRLGAAGKADLLPLNPNPQSGPAGFCRRQGNKLVVTVKNQGTADAGPSTTTVDFANVGQVSQPTPAIAAGSAVDVLFDFPAACFRPDCRFRIIVDSGNQVDESNETNNTADGACLG
jgi:hypothetical protein